METVIELSNGCILRKWNTSDVDSFLIGSNDPEVSKNLRPEFPRTREQIIEFIKNASLKSQVQDFAIVKGENLVGGISFIYNEGSSIELSCLWIAEVYRGNGIAKNVLKAMIRYVMKKYPGYLIIGKVYDFNIQEKQMVKEIGFMYLKKEIVLYHGESVSLYSYQYCF